MATENYSSEDDLYSEGASKNSPDMDKTSETETETTDKDGKSESGTPMALVPKDVIPAEKLEVGKVCEFKVERILDGQIQLSYVPHGKSEDEGDDMEEVTETSEIEEMMS